MRYLLAILMLVGIPAAGAATLTVERAGHTDHLTTAQLLARPDAREIEVPGDVSYHATRRYRAVPLRALLAGLDPADHLQFVALDGFAAEIPASLLMGGSGSGESRDGRKGAQHPDNLKKAQSEAWLAVEPPDAPWPALSPGKPGAGPFYLVWLHPEGSHIGPEQWPYQIATIRVLADPALRFPAMRPARTLSASDPVTRGFAVFQRNCLSCHTLNGQGDAKLGPDLNIPHSPMEYLREDMFRTLVRNPQAMRHWPEAKMPGFSADVLSDADMDALVAYLKHMSGRKAGMPASP